MLSVFSVPLMVSGSQPTMLTVDIAFRINAYGDYGVANALGVVSYLMTAITAWLYLRFAERWYYPFKLPVTWGLRYWEVVFRPTGVAMQSLVTNLSLPLLT